MSDLHQKSAADALAQDIACADTVEGDDGDGATPQPLLPSSSITLSCTGFHSAASLATRNS
jgi:hypothetical protein